MRAAKALLDLVMMRSAPVKAAMQVSVSEIIDEFYEDFATEESGRYWWWVQMVLLDPNELIVNNSKDELYRLPFTIGGADAGEPGETEVTFGEPKQVQIQYIDVAARADAVAAACTGIASVRGEKVAARFGNRAESRPNEQEGGSVDLIQLRESLGLPADTPETEVYRVAAERLAASGGQGGTGTEPETPAPGDGGGGSEESTETPGEPATPEPAPATEPQAGQPVLVDAEALSALRADAAAGREARDTQLEESDDRVLTSAVQAGKFPPSRKDHFMKLMKADREGTIALINSLEENVVPLTARGVQSEDNEGQGSLNGEAYPAGWLPEVAPMKAAVAARNGLSPRIMTDGVGS